jgi:hypothetical protein
MGFKKRGWLARFNFLNHFRHPFFFHHFRRRNLQAISREHAHSHIITTAADEKEEEEGNHEMIDLMESALLFQFQNDVSWLLSNGYIVITYVL